MDEAMSNDFHLRVVGERYPNRDGSSRQAALARCRVGASVDLRREPDNPADPGAVADYSQHDEQIGYLGADRAAWLRGKLDRGYDLQARIGRLHGGRRTGLPITAVLAINLHGEEPSVP